MVPIFAEGARWRAPQSALTTLTLNQSLSMGKWGVECKAGIGQVATPDAKQLLIGTLSHPEPQSQFDLNRLIYREIIYRKVKTVQVNSMFFAILLYLLPDVSDLGLATRWLPVAKLKSSVTGTFMIESESVPGEFGGPTYPLC